MCGDWELQFILFVLIICYYSYEDNPEPATPEAAAGDGKEDKKND